jgi:hypothetical protein
VLRLPGPPDSLWPKPLFAIPGVPLCRHCGGKEETRKPLLPIGARNHVWVHNECYDAWRKALVEISLTDDRAVFDEKARRLG